jgi:hypothetical protein
MKTALDRAANAICLIRGKRWAEITETEQVLFKEDAKAVLIALHVPSYAMIQEGVSQLHYDEEGGLLGGLDEIVERVFVAMVKGADR